MIPAAALAVVRSAVEVAHSNGRQTADDIASQVAEELTAQGWTIAFDHKESPALRHGAQAP